MDKIKSNAYLRVGIYLRLSQEDRDKQNKTDNSESIKNQRNMLMQYINKHPEFILIDEYCDEDLSGAGTFRPEFERLIKDCQNKKIDVVLCKSQSRFSRDMEIVEKYINNKFKEWNIRFIGLSDNADTVILGNKKSRQINGLVNEWYLEDVSNNIRSSFKSKMKQGEFISPFASFGYEINPCNNNKLIIDPKASIVVKKIYNLYLKGLGFTQIATYLNQKNIPSPSLYKYQKGIKLNIVSNKAREEIKWNANAIKTILTNELYLGNLIQGKRTTISYKNHKIITKDKRSWIKKENTHEAIIKKDLFNKVQLLINERTKPLKKTGLVHNFSGKVFCLECGSYMRKKNSSKHKYLNCTANTYAPNSCPNQKSIRYDLLEAIITIEINKKIKKYYSDEIIEKILSKKSEEKFTTKISSLTKALQSSEKSLENTNLYLKNLYIDKVNKIITNEQFLELTNSFKKDENNLIQEITLLKKELNFYKEKSITNNYQNIKNKYQKITKLNKVIIDELIDKIYIGKIANNNRIIKIKWNF